ncbi:golgin subfamily A member 6-like protein 7 [Saccostrea cucullata]|uniref:golgin subfamily A member 6-like protein 7 n=1 Tax=Saccostrea cuccullata TaxID=36930 RepID=UPI002ED6AFB9
MPRGKRSSTPKHGDQNKKSKAKNNSTESKSPLAERQEDSPPSELPVTSKIPVMPEVPVTPKTEDSQQGKEEESEKVINSEEQREKPDVEGKMDNQGTEGQKKRKNKKKNKQQNDEIGEVEKQVEDINKLDKPSERLWNKIEQHIKGCPEPLVKFFDDLVHGNHWTFLRDRKIEDIKQVLEICKNSHCSSSQRSKEETKENKQEQPSNKRERSARKGVDKTRTENQEELKKNETAELKSRVAGLTEVAELRRSLEVKEQEVKRFEAEKSHLQQDKEKIYHQLRRRDEDFLHIQNEYHKVEQNVRALNIKIRDEQEI